LFRYVTGISSACRIMAVGALSAVWKRNFSADAGSGTDMDRPNCRAWKASMGDWPGKLLSMDPMRSSAWSESMGEPSWSMVS